jgi:hypothetical protein
MPAVHRQFATLVDQLPLGIGSALEPLEISAAPGVLFWKFFPEIRCGGNMARNHLPARDPRRWGPRPADLDDPRCQVVIRPAIELNSCGLKRGTKGYWTALLTFY